MAISVFVRDATLADRADMRSLLTTKVQGVSPLDELVADYGVVEDMSLANLAEKIAQSSKFRVAVAYEEPARTVLRAWSLFFHKNGLKPFNLGVTDAWEHMVVVTDKRRTLAERLSMVNALARAAATLMADDTYVWADIKTPGNLDTAMQALYSFVSITNHGVPCHRFYAPATAVRLN